MQFTSTLSLLLLAGSSFVTATPIFEFFKSHQDKSVEEPTTYTGVSIELQDIKKIVLIIAYRNVLRKVDSAAIIY